MKSNYEKIGDHIREVNIRNKDLQVNTLLGINIDKYYMPSVANIIGTDLASYKIVEKGQFACNRMHVGRDYRLPVALSNDDESFIVSPAYDVFKIINEDALLPEFLMMWFRRKEFDRNAWFYTDADVRGGLPWKSFCDMEIPVPDIEKQKEIVEEYNTIVNRIELNNQLIQKLEETAQAIYRRWFVDFEFPDEEGKPYKSNGGEMIFNEELQKEIPKGWELKTLYKVANFINGAAFRETDLSTERTGYPIVKIAELKYGIDSRTGYTNRKMNPKHKIVNGDILYSWSGNPDTSLEVFKWFLGDAWVNQHIFKIEFEGNQDKTFTYYLLKELKPILTKLAEGKQTTGLGHVTVADMKKIIIPYPNERVMQQLEKPLNPLYNLNSEYIIEQINLKRLSAILLSKLALINN